MNDYDRKPGMNGAWSGMVFGGLLASPVWVFVLWGKYAMAGLTIIAETLLLIWLSRLLEDEEVPNGTH